VLIHGAETDSAATGAVTLVVVILGVHSAGLDTAAELIGCLVELALEYVAT
jgi:hypothetical protein